MALPCWCAPAHPVSQVRSWCRWPPPSLGCVSRPLECSGLSYKRASLAQRRPGLHTLLQLAYVLSKSERVTEAWGPLSSVTACGLQLSHSGEGASFLLGRTAAGEETLIWEYPWREMDLCACGWQGEMLAILAAVCLFQGDFNLWSV